MTVYVLIIAMWAGVTGPQLDTYTFNTLEGCTHGRENVLAVASDHTPVDARCVIFRLDQPK